MSRCTVCKHPKVEDINRRIREGEGLRAVAREYDIATTTLSRHVNLGCMKNKPLEPRPNELEDAFEDVISSLEDGPALNDVVETEDMTLSEEIEDIKNKTRAIYTAVMGREKPNYSMALAALGTLTKQVEVFANMMLKYKELQDREHDVNNDQDWIALRGRIIVALDPFPEAKRAVLAAMGVDLELVPVER